MPHHKGYRSKTRALFTKPFKKHGVIPLSQRMVCFKKGDYVDIKVNSTVHAGMPHKFYHGKTGKVYDITAHAIGVAVTKPVKQRIIMKKLHLHPAHLQLSQCKEDFLKRVHENHAKRLSGQKEGLKRQPVGPKEGHMVQYLEKDIVDQHPPVYKFTV